MVAEARPVLRSGMGRIPWVILIATLSAEVEYADDLQDEEKVKLKGEVWSIKQKSRVWEWHSNIFRYTA